MTTWRPWVSNWKLNEKKLWSDFHAKTKPQRARWWGVWFIERENRTISPDPCHAHQSRNHFFRIVRHVWDKSSEIVYNCKRMSEQAIRSQLVCIIAFRLNRKYGVFIANKLLRNEYSGCRKSNNSRLIGNVGRKVRRWDKGATEIIAVSMIQVVYIDRHPVTHTAHFAMQAASHWTVAYAIYLWLDRHSMPRFASRHRLIDENSRLFVCFHIRCIRHFLMFFFNLFFSLASQFHCKNIHFLLLDF